MTIPSWEVRKSSHGLDDFGGDSDQRWGGRDIKNRRGEIWEVPSDHNTTRNFRRSAREEFSEEKKIGGRGPTGPPTDDVTCFSNGCCEVVGGLVETALRPYRRTRSKKITQQYDLQEICT